MVSRKDILEQVWGVHEDTDTRAIDNFIVRLRRYIEDDAATPRHLLTVRSVGYRFVATRVPAYRTILAHPCSTPTAISARFPRCARSRASCTPWPRPPAGVPARARRSAAARARRAVPRSGDADRHPRPLHRPDAVLAGRADGGAGHSARGRRRRSKPIRARIWQLFGDHFHLFRGTPSGVWLSHEFEGVFGIREQLTAASASASTIRSKPALAQPEFRPRALFERFRIEVLVTTDAATDSLEWHQQIRQSGWTGAVRPTFRPDLAINLRHPRLARGDRAPGRADRARDHVLLAATSRRSSSGGVLQADGRDGHRPRRGDAVHRRAGASRRRGDVSSAPWRAGRRPTTCGCSPGTC